MTLISTGFAGDLLEGPTQQNIKARYLNSPNDAFYIWAESNYRGYDLGLLCLSWWGLKCVIGVAFGWGFPTVNN